MNVPLKRSSWRKRLLLVLAGAVAVAAVGLAAVSGYLFHAAGSELAHAIAETDRLDPGWRFEDLEAQRQLPVPEHNSALQVLTVSATLPPRWQIRPDVPPGGDAPYVDRKSVV